MSDEKCRDGEMLRMSSVCRGIEFQQNNFGVVERVSEYRWNECKIKLAKHSSFS